MTKEDFDAQFRTLTCSLYYLCDRAQRFHGGSKKEMMRLIEQGTIPWQVVRVLEESHRVMMVVPKNL